MNLSRYTWIKQTDHEQARALETGHPFPSPTMVGCAIAANKEFFMYIGAFDESLQVRLNENQISHTFLYFKNISCNYVAQSIDCLLEWVTVSEADLWYFLQFLDLF